MENEFNYSAVPYGFVHCYHANCPQATVCLRHLAGRYCPADHPSVLIINPICIPSDARTCPHHLTTSKVRVAWGVTHLYDTIPLRIAHELKRKLLDHFKKSGYYRYYRQEKGFSPQQQAYIEQLFLDYGLKEKPAFDSFTETYGWE